MSDHHVHASASKISQYLAAGVTGVAIIGMGASHSGRPDEPTTVTAQVRLMSDESALPTSNTDCAPPMTGCPLGSSGNPTPAALAAAVSSAAPMIGLGGWLIGDGIDADPTTCTAPCNGGNAGLLWGNGGKGALGGNGGNAGLWIGNGGSGGNGVDAEYDPTTGALIHAATAGGRGGSAGLMIGDGGDGGNGGADDNKSDYDPTGSTDDAFGGAGGRGVGGGWLLGGGGSGGDGGEARSVYGNATGGAGGAASGALAGKAGSGGNGGNAISDGQGANVTGGAGAAGGWTLTGNAGDDERAAARACGMDDLIVKPYSPATLRDTLVHHVAARSAVSGAR